MLRIYDIFYDTLYNVVKAPILNIMDNEASTECKLLLQKIITVLKLAPPHSHIINSVERAIRTFKNHFVA